MSSHESRTARPDGIRRDGILLTVAPTGAETAKADCPALPTTLEELVAAARESEAAGASMVHVHIRDEDHAPSLDPTRLRDTVQALHEQTDLVVQLSTGGSVHDPLEQRLKVLDAEPDSCSLTLGTVNFGDDVFMNPWPFVAELYQLAQERGVLPEFEIFDLGQVATLHRLLDTYGPPPAGAVHCDFVMGVPGGMPGHGARPGRRARRPPGRGHLLVGHRGRPHRPARRPDHPGDGRAPARGHGGHADPAPRGAGGVERPAGRTGRTPGRRGGAHAVRRRRGADAAPAARPALTSARAGREGATPAVEVE